MSLSQLPQPALQVKLQKPSGWEQIPVALGAVQALSQQTPPTQKVEKHCSGREHGLPGGRF